MNSVHKMSSDSIQINLVALSLHVLLQLKMLT